MDKEEIIGNIILQQFERIEKLHRKINDPAYVYYFRGIGRSVTSILFFLVFATLLILSRGALPVFAFMAFFIIFSEIIRQQERFNAFVKLIEIEKEEKIKCGKHLAEHANISGSKFHDVNLSGSDFNNVNLSKTRFHNINLSDIQVTAVQIGGATFKHIGPPPDKDGKQERQRPVVFEEAMLCDSTFRNVDMSNVKITDCNIRGMTIDGVLVTELLEEHKKRNG